MSGLVGRARNSLQRRIRSYRWSALQNWKRARKRWLRLGPPGFSIFIVGAQRSGTTFLERTFRRDVDSQVYGEFSCLAIQADRTVWKPLLEVRKVVDRANAKYVVARPLFESDRIAEILNFFPTATAVWMFREPHSVVRSMIAKWGDSFFDISRRVESDSDGVWRLESLYAGIRDVSADAPGRSLAVPDRYALYWLKRNNTIFTKAFDEHPRILFLDYRRLVASPRECVDVIMRRAGGRSVWQGFRTDAHLSSLGKSLGFELDPVIERDCASMYQRIEALGHRDFPMT